MGEEGLQESVQMRDDGDLGQRAELNVFLCLSCGTCLRAPQAENIPPLSLGLQ